MYGNAMQTHLHSTELKYIYNQLLYIILCYRIMKVRLAMWRTKLFLQFFFFVQLMQSNVIYLIGKIK